MRVRAYSLLAVKITATVVLLQMAILYIFIYSQNGRYRYMEQLAFTNLANGLQQTANTADVEVKDIDDVIDVINQTSKIRVQRLRQYCQEHWNDVVKDYPYKKYRTEGFDKWLWIRSEHHKLFYCATPKCGSTTWKSYLMEDLGINWSIDTHMYVFKLIVCTDVIDKCMSLWVSI